MNRFIVICGSSLLLGIAALPAMARIRPEPTMCFVRLSNGAFRDLTRVCGASYRRVGSFPGMSSVIPNQAINRQNTIINTSTYYTTPGTPTSRPTNPVGTTNNPNSQITPINPSTGSNAGATPSNLTPSNLTPSNSTPSNSTTGSTPTR
jgi:hypothetical protein